MAIKQKIKDGWKLFSQAAPFSSDLALLGVAALAFMAVASTVTMFAFGVIASLGSVSAILGVVPLVAKTALVGVAGFVSGCVTIAPVMAVSAGFEMGIRKAINIVQSRGRNKPEEVSQKTTRKPTRIPADVVQLARNVSADFQQAQNTQKNEAKPVEKNINNPKPKKPSNA